MTDTALVWYRRDLRLADHPRSRALRAIERYRAAGD